MTGFRMSSATDDRLRAAGGGVLRYSLAFFFLAFGLLKFTAQEAADIEGMMSHSLLLGWLHPLLGQRGESSVIGMIEVATGTLIVLRHFAPLLSALGSALAAFALLNTLSFLFTTPGLLLQSADAGFLMKDATLFGAALWSAGEALLAVREHAKPGAIISTAAA